MQIRRMRWAAALVAASLLATACGSDDASTDGDDTTQGTDSTDGGEGGDSDVIVLGALDEPTGLDPAQIYEKFGSNVLYAATDQLVTVPAGESSVQPMLATDWEISDDGLTYTFNLREGVKFHDGSDFDAEDVKFSFDRVKSLAYPSGPKGLVSALESVEVVDPLTVKMTLSEVQPTFLARIAGAVGSIVPSDSGFYGTAELEGSDENIIEAAKEFMYNEGIVGTGPLKLVDYRPGESMTFERFEDYWGEPAESERVIVQFFQETPAMKTALERGEIDLVVGGFTATERQDLEANADIQTFVGDAAAEIRYLVIDTNDVAPEVRRSLSAAIDRQRLVDEVLNGNGNPLYTMIPTAYEASVPAAEDLTVEITEPVDITLWFPFNKYDEAPDAAEEIKRQLEESGVFNVTTEGLDWTGGYTDNLTNGNYDVYVLGWFPDFLDPETYVAPFYGQEFLSFYQDDTMMDLIAQTRATTDQAERNRIYGEIQELAAQDLPTIPLYELPQKAYAVQGVTGVEETLDASNITRFWLLGKG